MEEHLKEIQKKAKKISRQYAQYKVVPTSKREQGASRGAHGQDGSQVLKMCYFNLTSIKRDSVRLQPTTELDDKMTRLQVLVNKYDQQNTFTMYIKGKIDYVLEVHKAEDKKTNIYTASRILGASMHAFQYIQFSEIPFGGIDLNLDEFKYEKKFRRAVRSKFGGKQEDYDGCLEEIDHAIDKCEEQLRKVVERCSEEEAAVNREGLVQSRAEMEKIAVKEQTDLTTIRKKCDDDIDEIDSTSVSLRRDLESAITDFKEAESAILRKHEELRRKEHEFQLSGANSQSQMEEIERLRKEDTANKTEKPKRENILMETEKAVTKATSELREWGKGITDLKDRVAASLDILEDMQGCARKIFDKAETQRKEWQKKLALLKVDCLKAKNDPLMAEGLIYRLLTHDCEHNIETHTQRQNKLDEKWKKAVRYSDKIEQERLQKKIQQCQQNTQEYRKIYEGNKTRQYEHVTRMVYIQRQLIEIVTASQVTVERIDCEPEEKLRQKFEELQVRMEAAFEHQSTANLRLITN